MTVMRQIITFFAGVKVKIVLSSLLAMKSTSCQSIKDHLRLQLLVGSLMMSKLNLHRHDILACLGMSYNHQFDVFVTKCLGTSTLSGISRE